MKIGVYSVDNHSSTVTNNQVIEGEYRYKGFMKTRREQANYCKEEDLDNCNLIYHIIITHPTSPFDTCERVCCELSEYKYLLVVSNTSQHSSSDSIFTLIFNPISECFTTRVHNRRTPTTTFSPY